MQRDTADSCCVGHGVRCNWGAIRMGNGEHLLCHLIYLRGPRPADPSSHVSHACPAIVFDSSSCVGAQGVATSVTLDGRTRAFTPPNTAVLVQLIPRKLAKALRMYPCGSVCGERESEAERGEGKERKGGRKG